MKKPNLSPEKGTTGKQLSKSPFKKIGKDLNIDIEYFHKLITKIITKHPLEPEEFLLDAFEKELASSKDPVKTWIKGNALEQLGYIDIAAKFKEKATILGYQVDSVMEAIAPQLEGKKIKLIAIKENVENIAAGTEGTIINHDLESDIISVKWDNGETTPILPEDKFEVLPQTNENFNNVEQGKQELPLEDSTKLNNTEPSSQTEQPLEDEPEYNKSALIAFIENDPFYRFTFHETATEDQDKDLEKFFKHYIKGDEKNEHLLQAYSKQFANQGDSNRSTL